MHLIQLFITWKSIIWFFELQFTYGKDPIAVSNRCCFALMCPSEMCKQFGEMWSRIRCRDRSVVLCHCCVQNIQFQNSAISASQKECNESYQNKKKQQFHLSRLKQSRFSKINNYSSFVRVCSCAFWRRSILHPFDHMIYLDFHHLQICILQN